MLLLSSNLTAGVDEVGRGCLAGPVVACAVILPTQFDEDELVYAEKIKDSKKLSAKQRKELVEFIQYSALDYSIAFVDNIVIDQINIRNATMKAIHKAIDGLHMVPENLLIDGDFYHPRPNEDFQCVEKGDSIHMNIAAASILAKEARDKYMLEQHEKYPYYGWNTNKGYGTKAHYEGLKKHDMCELHRKSFHLF